MELVPSLPSYKGEGGRKESVEDYLPTSFDNLESQVLTPNPTLTIAKKIKYRGGNFTPIEDTLLVASWLNTSLDSISGVDQSKHAFWVRIHEYYMENKNTTSCALTQVSLMNRWGVIQHATNKFCRALAQIKGRCQSGVTEQDKIEQANELYRSKEPSSFHFLHCWTILSHNPKWKEQFADEEKAKPKRRSIILNARVPEFTNLNEDTITPTIDVDVERPTRKKAEKKRKRQDSSSKPLADLVVDMSEEKKMTNAKKESEREEFLRLKKKKMLENKEKEEREIMRMDISSLPPIQREYWSGFQLEILKKRRSTQQ